MLSTQRDSVHVQDLPRGMFPAKYHSLKPFRLLFKNHMKEEPMQSPLAPWEGDAHAQTSFSCSSSVEKGPFRAPQNTSPPSPGQDLDLK